MTSHAPPDPLLDAAGVESALHRVAEEILARADGTSMSDLVLVGIRRRGVELAEMLAEIVEKATGERVDQGSLDITLYRDDFAQVGALPLVGTTDIPVDLNGRRVIVVDDVLYTGRTIRAALNEIADFGRPARIELFVLVDRGGRELPIQADYAGVSCPVESGQHVEVKVPDIDGELSARIVAAKGVGA